MLIFDTALYSTWQLSSHSLMRRQRRNKITLPCGGRKLRRERGVFFLFFFMEVNATFNNISATSWQSVFLMEEIGVPRENH
jgi:hypothetical protein